MALFPHQVHGQCRDSGSGYARSVVGQGWRVHTDMAVASRGVPMTDGRVRVGCDVREAETAF